MRRIKTYYQTLLKRKEIGDFPLNKDMAFLNNDVTGNYDLKKAIGILREFGQLTIKQFELFTNLNETEARMIMHQAFHKGLVNEVFKDKYVLKGRKAENYDSKLEYAITLAAQLCNTNEQFILDECIREKEDPLLVYMGTDEEDFDIIYVEEGKERLISKKIERRQITSNILAIIENKGQLNDLKIEKLCAVYIVKDGGLEFVQ